MTMKIKELEKYLDKRNIRAIVFDIDNTLLRTSDYYCKQTNSLSKKLSPQLDKDKSPEEISKLMTELLRKSYLKRKNRQPILINDWYLGGLNEYFNESIPKNIEAEVREFFKDFYNVVPTPYKKVPDMLKTIIKINRNVVLHSHAQEDWTAMKANFLSELIGYDIPYLATPIEEEKDEKSWLKAFNIVNTAPINTLVVGDNLNSDILPAIKAGSRNTVLINNHNEVLPEDIVNDPEVNILTITDISELLDILK